MDAPWTLSGLGTLGGLFWLCASEIVESVDDSYSVTLTWGVMVPLGVNSELGEDVADHVADPSADDADGSFGRRCAALSDVLLDEPGALAAR